MKVTALAPWFGSNRMLASEVGTLLSGCEWVGVPFAGGMSELPHIQARTIVANDLHRHVINLARVAAHPRRGAILYRRLRRLAFHPDTLRHAQSRCRDIEQTVADMVSEEDMIEWAENYFVTAWMGRSAKAGTDGEFGGGLPIRWNANGGDSCVRYRSAVKSLLEWRRVLERVNFDCRDAFEFLEEKCKDSPGHGIYCDPPFPDAGDSYRHDFTEADQRRLAKTMARFCEAKVVMRFYDHPLIRVIYPETSWYWKRLVGRKSTNEASPEVLITNFSAEGSV